MSSLKDLRRAEWLHLQSHHSRNEQAVSDPPGTAAHSVHQFRRSTSPAFQASLNGIHYHQPQTVLSDYTHLVPIFPDQYVIYVPSVFVGYCSHVRWWCEYLCIGAAVFLCAIHIVYYGYRLVSFNKVYPHSFVWVQTSVFVYVFVLGVFKTPYCVFLHLSPKSLFLFFLFHLYLTRQAS